MPIKSFLSTLPSLPKLSDSSHTEVILSTSLSSLQESKSLVSPSIERYTLIDLLISIVTFSLRNNIKVLIVGKCAGLAEILEKLKINV